MTSALQFWYRPPRVLRYLYKNRKRWKYPSVLKIRPQHLMWLKRIFINHKAKILDFLYSYVLGKSKLVCPSFIFSECLYLVQKCNISLCCKAAIFFFLRSLQTVSSPSMSYPETTALDQVVKMSMCVWMCAHMRLGGWLWKQEFRVHSASE